MKKSIVWVALLSIILSGCSDVFQKDIQSESVSILSPADNLHTATYSVTFWWDAVDGAKQYKVQIANPSFDNLTKLALDTTVLTTKMIYTLAPGTYQWRIRAENGGSTTVYVTRNLVIDTSSLTAQSVQVISPSSGAYINSKSVTFSWQTLFGTDNYQIQIDTVTGNFSGTMKLDQLTPLTSYTYIFPHEGEFEWRVRAINSTTKTSYTSARSFIIDVTSPTPPILTAPLNNSVINRPVSLTWNASTSLDIARYRVYTYTVTGTDTTELDAPFDVSGTSADFNSGAIGSRVVWKVKAIDFSGNLSNDSVIRSFTIGS